MANGELLLPAGLAERWGLVSVLDQLSGLAGDSAKLLEIEGAIDHFLSDEGIQGVLVPTPERLGQYFALLRDGFEYARREYGAGALPPRMSLYRSNTNPGTGRREIDFIGYGPDEDELMVSLVHMARVCSGYGYPMVLKEMSTKGRLRGYGVTLEDFTVLSAVETGFVRHLIVEGNETVPVAGRLDEVRVDGLYQRAVNDLNIRLYRLPPSRYRV